MITLPTGTHVWITAGVTDLRRGFTGLYGFLLVGSEISGNSTPRAGLSPGK
jgi:hypothetical protein